MQRILHRRHLCKTLPPQNKESLLDEQVSCALRAAAPPLHELKAVRVHDRPLGRRGRRRRSIRVHALLAAVAPVLAAAAAAAARRQHGAVQIHLRRGAESWLGSRN